MDNVNNYMMDLLPTEEKIYLSSNSISKVDANSFGIKDLYTPEFFNSIQEFGIANH